MKKNEALNLLIAEEGMLLTQAVVELPEERIFSSRVYDAQEDNWIEWTQEQVDRFIEERESATEAESGTL
jgi:hypothetical protein